MSEHRGRIIGTMISGGGIETSSNLDPEHRNGWFYRFAPDPRKLLAPAFASHALSCDSPLAARERRDSQILFLLADHPKR